MKLLLTLLLPLAALAAERPNILLVIADDCTHSAIGVYGCQAKTSKLDKLVTEELE